MSFCEKIRDFCKSPIKTKHTQQVAEYASFSSALERIRTPNPRSRNPIFYPVELRVQFVETKKPLQGGKAHSGDPSGTRTQDHYIKSVMLYQLS